MRVLVTGVAGFIGANLSLALVENGFDVVGVDCFLNNYDTSLKRNNADDLKKKGVDVQDFNLATESASNTIKSSEIIVHLAAQPGIAANVGFDDYLKNNFIATHRLLEAARQSSRINLFINISTSSVYGREATMSETAEPRPISEYGVTKLAAEQDVMRCFRDDGFPATSLRLYSIYGPRERPEKLFSRIIRSLLQDEPFPMYDGSQEHIRSFTYVGDAVRGIISAMRRPQQCVGEIINIGSPAAFTTQMAIETAESLVGKKAQRVLLPARAGDQQNTRAVISKATKLLDFRPTTDMKLGISLELEWAQQYLAAHDRLPSPQ